MSARVEVRVQQPTVRMPTDNSDPRRPEVVRVTNLFAGHDTGCEGEESQS